MTPRKRVPWEVGPKEKPEVVVEQQINYINTVVDRP